MEELFVFHLHSRSSETITKQGKRPVILEKLQINRDLIKDCKVKVIPKANASNEQRSLPDYDKKKQKRLLVRDIKLKITKEININMESN